MAWTWTENDGWTNKRRTVKRTKATDEQVLAVLEGLAAAVGPTRPTTATAQWTVNLLRAQGLACSLARVLELHGASPVLARSECSVTHGLAGARWVQDGALCTNRMAPDGGAWKRCTLAAIGAITGTTPDPMPMTLADCKMALDAAGWKLIQVTTPWKTTQALVDANPGGRWFFYTAGHALAYVDGNLVDTAWRGTDALHRIAGAWLCVPKAS